MIAMHRPTAVVSAGVLIALGLGLAAAPAAAARAQGTQSPTAAVATQTAQATEVPADLAAFVRDVGAQMRQDRTVAQRRLSAAARAIEKLPQEGEDRLYAALILTRASRRAAALDRLDLYLRGTPGNRELGLGCFIEAASWDEPRFAAARKAYEEYVTRFAVSALPDPFRAGVPLRITVEEAMARLNYLDGENVKGAGVHYKNALEVIEQHKVTLPLEESFRLKYSYADTLAATDKLDEAISFLEEIRAEVSTDDKTAARLEDFITFKKVDRLAASRDFASARALVEKNLGLVTADTVSVKRLTKLLERLKLVDRPAPELVPGRWVGGGPFSLAGLRGHVILLEFLTSG